MHVACVPHPTPERDWPTWPFLQHQATEYLFAASGRSAAVFAVAETTDGPLGAGKLQQALQEVAAVSGTTAADFCQGLHLIAALLNLQETLGGLIWLVACGKYLQDHPHQAGQTAYALLHVIPLTITEAPAGSSSSYQHKGTPLVIRPLADSSLEPDWVFFTNAYELQPTGSLSGVCSRAPAVQFLPTSQQYSAVPYVMPASAAAIYGCNTACVVAHGNGGVQPASFDMRSSHMHLTHRGSMVCCHVAGQAFSSVYAFTRSTSKKTSDPLHACKVVSAGERLRPNTKSNTKAIALACH
jgi:hypothetical protein